MTKWKQARPLAVAEDEAPQSAQMKRCGNESNHESNQKTSEGHEQENGVLERR